MSLQFCILNLKIWIFALLVPSRPNLTFQTFDFSNKKIPMVLYLNQSVWCIYLCNCLPLKTLILWCILIKLLRDLKSWFGTIPSNNTEADAFDLNKRMNSNLKFLSYMSTRHLRICEKKQKWQVDINPFACILCIILSMTYSKRQDL